MNLLFSTDTLMTGFVCDLTDCLSWLVAAINYLCVGCLLFCMLFKMTKTAKIIGFASCVIFKIVSIVVLCIHFCFFTIIGAIYTALAAWVTISFCVGRYGMTGKKSKENVS